MRTLDQWFRRKWMTLAHPQLIRAYGSTFATHDGQLVLQHLLDHIYFVTYEGVDPQGAVIHNARRSVVHEILLNIDAAENPKKYELKVEKEIVNAP